MNSLDSEKPFELDDELDQLYHGLPTIGVVIGTYAAMPYVHLQLESWRRFCSNAPLLVHDDASPKSDELKHLCRNYGVSFQSNKVRQPHHLGDLTAFVGGLKWADQKKVDILVKISRRWLFLSEWVEDLKELAFESQCATFTNYTTGYGFGFRTECIGLATKRWATPEFYRQTAAAIRRKLHVFVEAYMHQHSIQFEKANCLQAIRWKQEHRMPSDKAGYASWGVMGTDRCTSDRERRWLWHDCDQPSAYARIAKLWGLPYTEKDFEDPNQGGGVGAEPGNDSPFSKPSAWIGLENEYQRLLSNVRPIKRVVEIGVDYGWSLFHMALDFPRAEFIGVDPYVENPEAGEWVARHVEAFQNVKLLKVTSLEASKMLDGPFDLVHIDGAHDYSSVRRDFELWSPKVANGGCILFHDVTTIPDVRRLFDEIQGRKEVIRDHNGLGCWYKDGDDADSNSAQCSSSATARRRAFRRSVTKTMRDEVEA